MDTGLEQRVRERAYELWVAAGMQHGLADAHWTSAEQAVMSETAAPRAPAKKAAKTGDAKTASVKTVSVKTGSAKAAPARKAGKSKAA